MNVTKHLITFLRLLVAIVVFFIILGKYWLTGGDRSLMEFFGVMIGAFFLFSVILPPQQDIDEMKAHRDD